MKSSFLECLKVAVPLIFSWPGVALFIVIIFRKALLKLLIRLTQASEAKAELLGFKVEFKELAETGKYAVNTFNELNLVMAESRVKELEITTSLQSRGLSEGQVKQLEEDIEKLKNLIKQIRSNEQRMERSRDTCKKGQPSL